MFCSEYFFDWPKFIVVHWNQQWFTVSEFLDFQSTTVAHSWCVVDAITAFFFFYVLHDFTKAQSEIWFISDIRPALNPIRTHLKTIITLHSVWNLIIVSCQEKLITQPNLSKRFVGGLEILFIIIYIRSETPRLEIACRHAHGYRRSN